MEYKMMRELNLEEVQEVNGGHDDNSCEYGGESYSDGSAIPHPDGSFLTCQGGSWVGN